MFPVLETINKALGLATSVIDKSKQKETLNNTPSMQAAAAAQQSQANQDANKEAIADEDSDKIRRTLADD